VRPNEDLDREASSGWVGRLLSERYEVLALLGTGGMGTVFRARDLELEEIVALKVLKKDLIEIPGVVERFRREVKLARRVTHRNVARVFDIGEHDGDRFLTMELVEGEALGVRAARGSIPWDEALRISIAVIEGLSAAHAAGVVHRDLKPDNILLAKDGRVVITDFGIARGRFDEGSALRTFGTAVGTPAYMAPEQVEPDREVDARADLYSFGAVMFELFTGRRAWPGDSPIAVAAARIVQPPPDPLAVRPDLPEAYARIISRCLARKPEDRFPSAEAIRIVLNLPSPWMYQEEAGSVAAGYDVRTAPTLIHVDQDRPASRGVVSVVSSAGAPEASRSAVSGPAGSVVESGERVAASGLRPPADAAASGLRAPADAASAPSELRAPADAAGSQGTPGPVRRASVTMHSPVPGARPAGASESAPAVAVVSPSPTTGGMRSPLPAASPVPSSPSSAPASAPKTVAVLPFRNAGGPEDEYLADGLTDELIDTLSMTEGVRVRSRGVVMQHKGTDADPREIGAKLDVGLVVEGSIRRTAGAGVRITARIVSVTDGSQIWAKRFDRSTVDVFVVSDEVARAVAEALTLEAAAPPPLREAPADPEAMELYLRARQEYRKYWPDAVKLAVTLYEQALERAPENPTILSAYALACARLWWFGGVDGAAAGQRAREAAERAVAGAPHLGEPHLARAQVLWNSGDAAGAARSIAQALARAPTLAEAHALKGRILIEASRIEAGVKAIETATALEPTVPLAFGELARASAFRGNWDAIPELAERNAKTEGPQALWFMRARFAMWQRDKAQAVRLMEQAKVTPKVLAVARWLLEQLLASEPPKEVIDLSFFVAKDEASARRRSFIYQLEGEARAFHGQSAAALTSIERSVDEGLFDLAWMERCPLLAELHDHARFQASRAVVEGRVREALRELG